MKNFRSDIVGFLLDVQANNSGSTAEQYASHLYKFLEFVQAEPGKTWNRSIATRYIQHVRNKSGLASAQNVQTAIKSFYGWLVSQERLDKNPLENNPRSVRYNSPGRREVFTEAEYERIKAVACDGKWDYWCPAVKIAWGTGLRLGDIATLDWDEVFNHASFIRLVPNKIRKFNKRVEIPLSEEMQELLIDLKDNQEPPSCYVLPAMAHQYKRDWNKTLSVQFGRILDKAGVEGKSFHFFRHAFVTRCLGNNVNPAVVASMTGQSLKVIMGYCHPSIEQKREQMKGML